MGETKMVLAAVDAGLKKFHTLDDSITLYMRTLECLHTGWIKRLVMKRQRRRKPISTADSQWTLASSIMTCWHKWPGAGFLPARWRKWQRCLQGLGTAATTTRLARQRDFPPTVRYDLLQLYYLCSICL